MRSTCHSFLSAAVRPVRPHTAPLATIRVYGPYSPHSWHSPLAFRGVRVRILLQIPSSNSARFARPKPGFGSFCRHMGRVWFGLVSFRFVSFRLVWFAACGGQIRLGVAFPGPDSVWRRILHPNPGRGGGHMEILMAGALSLQPWECSCTTDSECLCGGRASTPRAPCQASAWRGRAA